MRVKLYVIRINGDDPKKSTALKLVRLGLATRISPSKIPLNAIVLDPFSGDVLSPRDSTQISKYGLVVVDTSWNKPLDDLRKIFKSLRGNHKILPLLFAGNPVNYAQPTRLSSVEALAAALYITGFKEEAELILSKFSWGHTFLELNKDLLDAYSKCRDADEVLRIQYEVLDKLRFKSGRARS